MISFREALAAVALCAALFGARPVRAEVSFVREVAPVLLKRCAGCHGERKDSGNYRLHTFAGLMRAGESGKPAVVAGKPAASELFRRIDSHVEAERMPQADDPLSPIQIGLFRRWILEGAKFDGSDRTAALKSILPPRQHPASPAAYRAPVPVKALAFAPGGGELAVGSYNEVTVWNATTGALVRRIPHLPQRIQSLAYSKDGKLLLVAGGTPGEYGEVALVDVATGARSRVLDTFDDIVLSAVFSADGQRVAAGGADASVRVFSVAGGKRLWTSRVHSDWVTSVSFSADGKHLASASKDMTVKVYEVENGALFATYMGHNRQIGQYRGAAPVYAVAFAPDGPLALSAGGGKWIHAWDPVQVRADSGDAGDMEDRFAKQGRTRYIPHGFEHEVFALAVRDGQVFAASADGVLKQFDLATLKEVRAFKGHTDWIFVLDYDAPRHRVATGSYNGEVRVWDTQTGECVTTFRAQPRADGGAAAAKR